MLATANLPDDGHPGTLTRIAFRAIIARGSDAGQIGAPLTRPGLDLVAMAIFPQRWRPASRRRLIACLAGSLLLHAGTLALVAAKWPGRMSRPAIAPMLELRLLQTPASASAAAPSIDPLLKDTLSDKSAPATAADAAPKPAAAVGGARASTRTAARERAAQRKLAEHLFYPPEAVAAGIEGEVRLLLTLDPAGNVLEAAIASGSGHPALDGAALQAAYAMRRLPGAGAREFILPVVFRLE